MRPPGLKTNPPIVNPSGAGGCAAACGGSADSVTGAAASVTGAEAEGPLSAAGRLCALAELIAHRKTAGNTSPRVTLPSGLRCVSLARCFMNNSVVVFCSCAARMCQKSTVSANDADGITGSLNLLTNSGFVALARSQVPRWAPPVFQSVSRMAGLVTGRIHAVRPPSSCVRDRAGFGARLRQLRIRVCDRTHHRW